MQNLTNSHSMKSKISLYQASCASPSSEQTNDAHASERLINYRLFLVPVDFSEHSKKTIQYARQLAALTGAGVRLLHVFQMPEHTAAFYHGLYLENKAVKIHLETAKCEAAAQLSLIDEQMRADGLQADGRETERNPSCTRGRHNLCRAVPSQRFANGGSNRQRRVWPLQQYRSLSSRVPRTDIRSAHCSHELGI